MPNEMSPGRELERNFDRHDKEEIRRALRQARAESTNPNAADAFLRLVNKKLQKRTA